MPAIIPAAGASPSYMPQGGELADLEERRAGVEQAVDALARQQLAARDVPLARLGVAAERDLAGARAQVVDLALQ